MIAGPIGSSRPEVRLRQGRLVGLCEQGGAAFRGIPYAAPPVGPLRWCPPQPTEAWSGVRDAGSVGAVSVQPVSTGDPGVGPFPASEDCLTLNVWAPPETGRSLPVMVWIHGGGYNNGSGTASLYDGANLARRGVVVVTFNYRLGRLGFFDHPALASERKPDDRAGNYGVMDQISALEWVRDNVAAFGGDPGRVTLFGESAGGVAVTQLMVAPSARGLFHGAVVQSGMGAQRSALLDRDQPGRPSAQSLGVAFARSSGLDDAVTASALRALPAERLLTPTPPFYSDNLLVDGAVVPEDVVEAFTAGRQAPVPLLIGSNSAEFWGMSLSKAGAYGRLDAPLTDDEDVALVEVYGGRQAFEERFVTDLIFSEPARRLARLHASSGQPTWLYRFDVHHGPEAVGGAVHAADRPYVFDNLDAVGGPHDGQDATAARLIADYWTGFAGAGDPNGAQRPLWPAFAADTEQLLTFANEGAVAGPVPFKARLDLITAFYRRVRH